MQNGSLGIGVTPTQLFHAESSINGDWISLIKNTHATNGHGLKVQAGDDADVDSFRVASVGNATLFNINGAGTATFSGDVLVAEYIKHEGDTDTNIRFQTDHIDLTTANTLALRVDSSQRVGIGVTPKAWTIFTPLQISTSAVLTGRSGVNQLDLANNWYYDGAEKRINTGYVARYTQGSNGDHSFLTAGTDSADATITFTTNMVIDNNSRISLSNNDGGGTGGDSSTTGNTLLGHAIGDMDVNSINNTLIGHKVAGGATHDDMRYNVGVGILSLYDITQGDSNVAIGAESAQNLTTGNQNIAIGRQALNTATVSSNIVAIGLYAGLDINDSGADGSVLIGRSAGENITLGSESTAVGFQSLDANTIGHYNTALGHNSLSANVAGDSNTGIGARALISCNPADGTGYNSSLGFNSGYFITNGEGNTIVGAQSGATGSNNLSTGDNNTLIGKSVGTSIADAQNQTVIGATATGQADNSVTLGNASVTDVYMAQDSGAVVHTAGIQFPASQVANGGANVLDDYEEGTWTPIVKDFQGTPVAFTAGAGNAGTYTKVGRMVTCNAFCSTSADNGASGFVAIHGLPFAQASGSDTAVTFGNYENFAITAGHSINGNVFDTNQFIGVYVADSTGGSTNMSVAEWSPDGRAYLSVTYFTD